jgi:hypothetical protein
MKTWLSLVMLTILLLSACSAPPPPVLLPVVVETAEIGAFVTNASDIPNVADLTWVEIKGEYEIRFDNGTTLAVGHDSVQAYIHDRSDGGYYKLLVLKPGENSQQFLSFTFFHEGEILVIEGDSTPMLYFKYQDGKVYLTKPK